MSEEPEEKEKTPKPQKSKNFSTATGDRVRGEHKRSGLIKTLIAGALGGTAYGVHRSAEKLLPKETRIALDATEREFKRLQTSRALSGDSKTTDDVLRTYSTQAARLAATPVAGMTGHEFIKLLRTRLPIKDKWQPHVSDAHYAAFARGPAYGTAQILDETAENIGKYPNDNKSLKQYMVEKFHPKFSEKLNATAAAHGAGPMDVGPSLRESLAYRGSTMAADKQPGVMNDIVSGKLFTDDRLPFLGGFSDHYKKVKDLTADELMTNSFNNYTNVGHKAKGVYNVLNSTLPALLGAAGVGIGGVGIYKLIKSMQRTAYEKSMIDQAERAGMEWVEKEDVEEQTEPPEQKAAEPEKQAADLKKKTSAVGIPDRSDYGDTSQLKPGELVSLIVQEHRARRAGKHFDVRLGDKDRGLLSWSTRYGLPDDPGKPRQLHQQPLHSYAYKDFEGEIPEGYGAGLVKKILEQRVLVTRANGGVSFTSPKGERMRFSKQNGDWLATKAKPLDPPQYAKEHIKSVDPDDVDKLDVLSAEPKIDGALHIMRLLGGDPELLSHRTSKRHGGPIVHTERVFGGRPSVKVPPELQHLELLGEVYAKRNGQTLSPEELTGLLNADLDKSITKQRAESIKMRLALHGISGSTKPRAEQRQLLAQAAGLLPDTLEVTPEVKGRAAAIKLLETIRAGKHPLTREGIIVHTPDGPRKVKLGEESDVVVRDTFPGKNRLAVKGLPGGFSYSKEPKGPIIGRVGSGLSDETRAALSDYIGRTARVSHHGTGASGALKKPSFIALHEDYPSIQKTARALSLTDKFSHLRQNPSKVNKVVNMTHKTLEINNGALDHKDQAKQASAMSDPIYNRLLQHEGGTKKVTVDTGGTTKGGISAKGTGLTPKQIKALSVEDIRKRWTGYWDQSGKHFNDPRLAEIAVNYAGNAGPATFTRNLQQTLNRMNRNAQPLKVDGRMGDSTATRINSVDPTALGTNMVDSLREHQEGLVTKNPAKFQQYQTGWANRRKSLSGLLSAPAAPVKVTPQVPAQMDATSRPIVTTPPALPQLAKSSSAVADWLRGDDKGADWRWGLAGSIIPSFPVSSLTNQYVNRVLLPLAGAPRNLEERRIFRGLAKQVRDAGVNVTDARTSTAQALVNDRPTLGNMLRKLVGLAPHHVQLGSSYAPGTAEVLLAKGMKSPGILAHELGHIRGGKGLMAANLIGKPGMGAMTALSLLSPTEEAGSLSALLGTAFGGGVLASELDASRRGFQAIRALGGGRKTALKAFIGVPTYMAAGALPLLSHYTKKHMGGYEKNP